MVVQYEGGCTGKIKERLKITMTCANVVTETLEYQGLSANLRFHQW